MPYKDKKKQAEYMRKYRTPYMQKYYADKNDSIEANKKAIVDLQTTSQELLDKFKAVSEQRQLASTNLREAINVIFQVSTILKNPNLTDAQKVEQTRNVPLSDKLIEELKKKKEVEKEKEII
jgi:hypothetical protein